MTPYRFIPLTPARILLFLILFTYICVSPAWAKTWGKLPYQQEVGKFKARKTELTRQINQVSSRGNQVQNQLQAFLASWSKADRAKAFNWFQTEYKNARSFKNRYQESQAAYKTAASDYEDRYRELSTIDKTLDGSFNRHARDVLWSAELRMLERKLIAMRDELRYRDLELQAIKAYEGIYWTDFFNDTMNDLQYILRRYVDSLTDEFFKCFLNTATAYGKSKMLKRPPPQIGAGFGTLNKSGQLYQCARGIALNSIVNALESAVRKQFVDSMEDKGIETQVAEFWWTDYVMPKAANQSRTHQAMRHYFSLKFLKTQLNDEAKRYLQSRLYADIKGGLINRLKSLGSQARYGDNAKRLNENTAKDRVAKHTAMQALEAADFTVKYGEQALTLYYNQVGFEDIAADLINKRRIIKECLRKKKKPDHAPAIISVFKYSVQGWLDFLRDCREADGLGQTIQHPFSGGWSWQADCRGTIYTGSFSISKVTKDGKFSGSFGGSHRGTIQGQVTGQSGFTFTRTFGYRKQTWQGSVARNRIRGTLSDLDHSNMELPTNCSFTATRR